MSNISRLTSLAAAGAGSVDPIEGVQQAVFSGPSNNSDFGRKVAISADGNTGVTAANAAIYTYTRSGDAWTLESTLSITCADVALTDDGNMMAVGQPAGYDGVRVYTRSGGTWTQQAQFTRVGKIDNEAVGSTVEFNEDGTTLVIGCPNYLRDSRGGGVLIYVRSGTTWSQQTFFASPISTDSGEFGMYGLGVSKDGNVFVIGHAEVYTNTGRVFVYTRTGTSWARTADISANTTSQKWFGFSADISDDGNTIAIGSRNENSQFGAAYLYTLSGGTWTQQQRIAGPSQGEFGYSVALSGDASTLIVGAQSEVSSTQKGAAYIYRSDNNTSWGLVTRIVGSNTTTNHTFGASLDLSRDGSTAVIGAPGYYAAYNLLGWTYFFV